MDVRGFMDTDMDNVMSRQDRVTCPPALAWGEVEAHLQKVADNARTLWCFNVTTDHLYIWQQTNMDGVLVL